MTYLHDIRDSESQPLRDVPHDGYRDGVEDAARAASNFRSEEDYDPDDKNPEYSKGFNDAVEWITEAIRALTPTQVTAHDHGSGKEAQNPSGVDVESESQLTGQPAYQAWRSIENAPRNKYILVPDHDFVGVGYWDRDPASEGGQCWRWHDPDSERIEPPPTHWMPLPDPPITQPTRTTISNEGRRERV